MIASITFRYYGCRSATYIAKPGEVAIVVVILAMWMGIIWLFVHKWSRIRALEPFLPPFQPPDKPFRPPLKRTISSKDRQETFDIEYDDTGEVNLSRSSSHRSSAYGAVSDQVAAGLMACKSYRKK